jgi:hypothetical protein
MIDLLAEPGPIGNFLKRQSNSFLCSDATLDPSRIDIVEMPGEFDKDFFFTTRSQA